MTYSSPLQLVEKYLPMRFLMCSKFSKLGNERSRSKRRKEKLARVDMDCTILARMVHFEDASRKPVSGQNSRAQFHEA